MLDLLHFQSRSVRSWWGKQAGLTQWAGFLLIYTAGNSRPTVEEEKYASLIHTHELMWVCMYVCKYKAQSHIQHSKTFPSM